LADKSVTNCASVFVSCFCVAALAFVSIAHPCRNDHLAALADEARAAGFPAPTSDQGIACPQCRRPTNCLLPSARFVWRGGPAQQQQQQQQQQPEVRGQDRAGQCIWGMH
jgi:hypothetical protein